MVPFPKGNELWKLRDNSYLIGNKWGFKKGNKLGKMTIGGLMTVKAKQKEIRRQRAKRPKIHGQINTIYID